MLYNADGSTSGAGGACAPNCANPWQTSLSLPFTAALSFALPIGAGAGRFVQIKVTSVVTSAARYSAVTPGALSSYAPPAVVTVAVAKARFICFNVATAGTSSALPCPFSLADTAANAAWSCANAALVALTLSAAALAL